MSEQCDRSLVAADRAEVLASDRRGHLARLFRLYAPHVPVLKSIFPTVNCFSIPWLA